ncbi:MAG: hypothetical protein UT18_C0006G0049 [candidate division CPR2 bacterium GW2011_GWC2_39_10]|uniref:Uncharacterized protein n=1 Tax=candidate division CPR2 bacterium GW2011_GWC2_39_10 TaxID=1618345 RepID=A0A0G0PZS1_UNCC2|nr:MAG: hypothetical protein UT18_C0006G0049 [candidate division CPR2 bacterium GW2011_GWC2_39_10]
MRFYDEDQPKVLVLSKKNKKSFKIFIVLIFLRIRPNEPYCRIPPAARGGQEGGQAGRQTIVFSKGMSGMMEK